MLVLGYMTLCTEASCGNGGYCMAFRKDVTVLIKCRTK